MKIEIKEEDLKIFNLALKLGISECDRIGLSFKTDNLKEILGNLNNEKRH